MWVDAGGCVQAEDVANSDWAEDITAFTGDTATSIWLEEVKKKLKDAAASVVLQMGLGALFKTFDADGSGELDEGEFAGAVRQELEVRHPRANHTPLPT